jgi:hypothetical protein
MLRGRRSDFSPALDPDAYRLRTRVALRPRLPLLTAIAVTAAATGRLFRRIIAATLIIIAWKLGQCRSGQQYKGHERDYQFSHQHYSGYFTGRRELPLFESTGLSRRRPPQMNNR